jgi:hypothetical protein
VPGPLAAKNLAAEIPRVFPGITQLTGDLGKTLGSRGYPSLRVETQIVPGMKRWTICGFAFPMGLRSVFAPGN